MATRTVNIPEICFSIGLNGGWTPTTTYATHINEVPVGDKPLLIEGVQIDRETQHDPIESLTLTIWFGDRMVDIVLDAEPGPDGQYQTVTMTDQPG